MEPDDAFTLRNHGMRIWLVGLFVVVAGIVTLDPPSFWLAAFGAVLAIIGHLFNASRTSQWYTWQRSDKTVTWFEGWAFWTAGILILVPMLGVIVHGGIEAMRSA